MPADFSLAMSALSSSIVFGGAVMPAFSNRSLRYQKPTTWSENGTPYCLPSTCQPPAAAPTWLIQGCAALGDVHHLAGRDLRAIWPPPHCW